MPECDHFRDAVRNTTALGYMSCYVNYFVCVYIDTYSTVHFIQVIL